MVMSREPFCRGGAYGTFWVFYLHYWLVFNSVLQFASLQFSSA